MKRLSKKADRELRWVVKSLCARGEVVAARESLDYEGQISDVLRHELNDIITSAERNEDQRVIWSAIRTLREDYTGDLPKGVSSLEEALAKATRSTRKA